MGTVPVKFYLLRLVDVERLKALIDVYVYRDARMIERGAEDIVRRLSRVFADRGFMATLANPRMNWLQMSPQEATKRLLTFVREKI